MQLVRVGRVFAIGGGLLFAVAGCSADWGESDLRVDYRGTHLGEVNACALLSSSVEHFDETWTVTVQEATAIAAESRQGHGVVITGRTFPDATDKSRWISWTCEAEIDASDGTMTATLGTIKRDSE